MYFTPRRYPFTPFPDGPDHHEVLVVGAGPVGLAAALGLARRGVRVTVLEAGDSVSYGSRAICLSRHSMEMLERLGVGERFDERSLPWTSGRSFYRATEVLAFDMPQHGGDVRAPMVNLSQSVAEQLLVDAVDATDGCEIRWQCRVTGCEPAGDHVRVHVDTPDGARELRTGWLVATDGARSSVRQSLGLRMAGTSYEGRYLIADIHWPVDHPPERRVWFDPPGNPGQTVILHRQPDDIWRVDCQLPPGADADTELAEDRVRARVGAHLDWLGNTTPWTLEWASLYRAHALSLDSYHHGRVLFAGDAAHLVPIFGVRGLNSGLEDADTLAWTLASVVHGTAGTGLLDTYSDERRAAWQQNIDQADKSTLFMTPGTRGYQLTRDAALALANRRPVLRNLINPRQSAATHARTSPLTVADAAAPGLQPGDPAGDRAVRAIGPDGTRSTSLNAERGPHLTLLGVETDAGALADAAAALAKRLAPAVAVRGLVTRREPGAGNHPEVTVLDDAAGAVAELLGGRPGEVFLIRPDGLLLARFTGVDHLDPDQLAQHVLTGGNR